MKFFSKSIVILIVFITGTLHAQEGTFTDVRDNHEYSWIMIGGQTWMSENLAYLPQINAPDELSNNAPRYYVYGFKGGSVAQAKSTSNYKTYGVLYNWTAALKACPQGWHLPSSYEWDQLAKYVSSQFGGNYDIRGFWSNIGKPLKSIGTLKNKDGLWKYSSDTNTGTDLTGFTGLPGGRCYRGQYSSMGNLGIWWSLDQYSDNASKTTVLNYSDIFFYSNAYNKNNGLSVRCVKDF